MDMVDKIKGVTIGIGLLLSGSLWANDQTGSWSDVIDWNINPIHAVLSPEKKLLTFGQGGGVEYSVWDLDAGTGPGSRQLIPNNTPTDLFCSSQIVLPQSGTVMTAGGDQPGPTFIGNPGTTFFDGSNNALLDAGYTMSNPRWYPTLTTLPNGEILVQGGRDQEEPLIPILTPEVYNPNNGWRSLLGISSEYAYAGSKWWYPRSWVTPNGLIFGITGRAMYHLDYQNDGKLLKAGSFDGPNTFETSTAVMYRPGKILQLGGGRGGNVPENPATNLATLLDVTTIEPVVTDATPLHFARHWANSTVLPDGNVLVTGGSQLNNSLAGDGPVYAAEIWNPDTNRWSLLSAEVHARLYHSFAILLPDATILSAGGGEPGPLIQKHGQIFSPPYLFDGASLATRPQISVDTTALNYGGQINIQSSSEIDRFTLVKTGAVTHSFNNDQRFIELSFTRNGSGNFTAQLPASPYIATPGYYYLFALNEAGTPSIAEIMQLAPDASIQLPALPELIDPQDLLENCVYPEEGGWGYDPVADTSCRPLVADDSDACDYSQADEFGGHGWNPSTETSCPPLDFVYTEPAELVDACDYSRADEYNGYGFNPVTLESCPPLNGAQVLTTPVATNTVVTAEGCDYSSAASQGGYGWNPTSGTSCPPLEGTVSVQDSNTHENVVENVEGCDYSSAASQGGYGWNPTTGTSCPPLTGVLSQAQNMQMLVIDNTNGCDYSSAASQGGYGWNPTSGTSCPPLNGVLSPGQNTQVPVADNTDDCDYSSAASQGGYGWNPTTQTSCPPR